MGTEKFIAFKEDGSAYRLKGRILRFLDNEPVSEADKTNIRSTLSVPASAEGLTPANNLSDLDNAATARTNLSVNSIDEDAESAGTKLVGPALYFDGVDDFLEVSDDSRLSFTDGTDDLPFSISAWVQPSVSGGSIISKQVNSVTCEWDLRIGGSGAPQIRLFVTGGTANRIELSATESLTNDQWHHVLATYDGSESETGLKIYINGVDKSGTGVEAGTYTQMSDTASVVQVGKSSSAGLFKGHIKDVKIFNRELTAAEVAQLARGTDLGFSEEWGGSVGGVYTQDSTPSGEWTATNGTDSDEAGPIGGRSNVLKLTVDATAGEHSLLSPQNLAVGKKYRIDFDYYMPSTNSDMDGLRVRMQSAATDFVYQNDTATQDAWTRVSIEVVGSGNQRFWISGSDGGSFNFTDSGGDDVLYIDGLTVTAIGNLADFRAESFDEDTGKIYDLSDNAFVGTSANLPTLTGRAYPVYETGTWTPSVTFGGGSTGITYSVQIGYYTRIGNLCYVSSNIVFTNKGSDTGTALITGLPFTSAASSAQNGGVRLFYGVNLAGLTSAPECRVTEGGTTITLQDWGATGVAVLDDTNFTNTSSFRFDGWYQIQ